MTVACLGSSGLIGRAVARLLEVCGDKVNLWDVDNGDLAYRDNEIGEYADYALEGCEAVVHLAGRRASVASQEAQGFDLIAGNLSTDIAVFKAARKAKIRKLVYASTISTYGGFCPEIGWTERDHVLFDRTVALPDDSVRFSAGAKLTAERLIEDVAAEGGPTW